MPTDVTYEPEGAPQRWDRLLSILSAEPRRQMIISLLDQPPERRLPVPEAADSPNITMDPEEFQLVVRHQHLPMLEAAGYIRWDRERSLVQRGPNFREAGDVMTLLIESVGQYPDILIEGCKILEEQT